ncbi:MAG: hypothetical protein WA395_16230 [Nitrososphaeraceae archaeon]|jgi:hypothetical protein
MSKDSNRKYVTISMIAIIAALIGTLAISQVLQPLHAQNTSGQMGQKLGNVSGAAANKTGNQSSNPLAKVGEALKGMFGSK